jgi:hypothetical protein
MPSRKPAGPWDAARLVPVVRGCHMYEPAPLEPGVRFFVLMLERLGCTTLFSCEGHPDGFYVSFQGPPEVARAVEACGFLTVSLHGAGYRLSLDWGELHARRTGVAWTARRRNRSLRLAASALVDRLGPLDAAPGPPPGPGAIEALIDAATVAAYTCDEPALLRKAQDAAAALERLRAEAPASSLHAAREFG